MKATYHLNYPGDVRSIVGEVKGPNLFGEWFSAVTADYDTDADRTRVGFAIGVLLPAPQEVK